MAEIYRSPAGKQIVEDFYRNALRHWPVLHRQLVVPTCEGDTFVVVSGEAHESAMVLFHGSGSNAIAWSRDVATWSRHYRVYSVDLIGEPGLSAPSRPPLGSDRYARWLDDVWDQLGLMSASVVGLSLGGWLALDYAVRRPHRVRSLSLLAPAGVGGQNRLVLLKVLPLMLLGRWGRNAMQRAMVKRGGMSPEVSHYLAAVFQHFRPRLARIPVLTDQELASLPMPVQLIVGGRDVLLRSCETRDRMTRLVRNLHLSYLEEAGHLLPSQAQNVLEFVDDVMEQHSRRSA